MEENNDLEESLLHTDESVQGRELLLSSRDGDEVENRNEDKENEVELEDDLVDYGLVAVIPFASSTEKIFYLLGILSAWCFGAIIPLMIQIMGKMLGGNSGGDKDAFAQNIDDAVPKLLGLGAIAFLSGYLQTFVMSMVAERLVKKIRMNCLKSLLNQEVGYFDSNSTGSLSTLLAEQAQNLLKGLSDSVGRAFQSLSMMVISFAIGFSTDARIAGVLMGIVPGLIVMLSVFIIRITKMNRELNNINEDAGGFAEEMLGSIRTVASLCAEERAIEKYKESLKNAKVLGMSMSNMFAVVIFMFFALLYTMFGVAYWYGSHLVATNRSDFGAIYTTVMSCTMGAVSFAGLIPCFQEIAKAKVGVTSLLRVINRQPKQYTSDAQSDTAIGLSADIEFRNVFFKYPSRDNYVLNDISFTIKGGQTCALVGQSGCGKSTCIQLLERFYDCSAGAIFIDGKNIESFSLKYLRSQISLVSQEPILFATTIAENIWLGLEDDSSDGSGIDMDRVVAAAKQANAHDFIMGFENQYDTQCGSQGTQLSGGQKQRISIARALIRNPKICLLDEATSALDYESEAVVQKAIDDMLSMSSMTTIVVAHRLSTIINADQIIVFAQKSTQGSEDNPSVTGSTVVEQGTNDELMQIPNGVYRSLTETGYTGMVANVPETIDEEAEGIDVFEEDMENYSRISRMDSISSVGFGESATGSFIFSSALNSPGMGSSISRMGSDGSIQKGKLKGTRTASSISSSHYQPLLDEADDDDDDDDAEEDLYPVKRTRLWAETADSIKQLIAGIFSAGIAGGTNPLTSIVLSHALSGFILVPEPTSFPPTMCTSDSDCTTVPGEFCAKYFHYCAHSYYPGHGPNDVKSAGFKTFYLYLILGLVMGLSRGINTGAFGHVSQKLTCKLKGRLFSSYVRMDAKFHDKKKNHPGVLVSKLATDPLLVQNVTGDYWALMVTNFFGIIAALIISFKANVKFTLVILAPCALFVLSSFSQHRQAARDKVKHDTESGKSVNQALNSVRTVYSCNAEKKICDNYEGFLNLSMKAGIKNANYAGLANGLSQLIMQAVVAFSYWYGAVLLRKGDISPQNLFKVINALQVTGQAIGATFARANDTSKADVAISNIYKMFDSKNEIDYSNPNGVKDVVIKGNVTFHNVSFAYPSRATTIVLRRFSCRIKAGQTVAFVGRSGSGKSTCIQLLERLYDPLQGSIHLDGIPLVNYNISFLRNQIGIVGQEPVLFRGTILENVAYGLETDDTRSLKHDTLLSQVIEACKMSNAHKFISGFPDGYNTLCGSKGTQLSGGQKQRIAIARALIKNPSLLLLDEATSALDNESETLVQEALDKVMQNRTTVVVAHRLSTIRNADMIFVMDKGVLVEKGTHEELIIREKGSYKGLYEMSQ